MKADITKSGTIHKQQILGDFNLYKQSDPALGLAIQYCQREKERMHRSS